MPELDLDALAGELSEFAPPPKSEGYSPREERILAGFEEIQRFVEKHGHRPRHGEQRDIFERLYAVRLDRLRELEEARALLQPFDHQGLLSGDEADTTEAMDFSVDELAKELGGPEPDQDIRVLRHVTSSDRKEIPEEIANRKPCEDFSSFRPIFDQMESDLTTGIRSTVPFKSEPTFLVGDQFILGGQFVHVAEKGSEIMAKNGQVDARLRVIYSNGTESNLLMRSLHRALEKDPGSRRVTASASPNLFSGEWTAETVSSGTIYVLRSHSTHPFISEHRELIHKIGVTGGSVESRIADAKNDATYLLADVEIVATYKLSEVNRTKLEALIHRLFGAAQIDVTIEDRFGHPVRPKEWFLVPLQVIDQAVMMIRDGTITKVVYDPHRAELVPL